MTLYCFDKTKKTATISAAVYEEGLMLVALLLLLLCLAECACLLADLEWSLLKVLAAEERKVTVVGEAIHLDNALKRHIGLGEETLNLDDTLLLHPAIGSVVELLFKHIVEVLNAKATDVGKFLDSLYAWRIIAHERCERLVAVEEVVECAKLNLWCVEELEDYEHLLDLRALQVVTLH